MMKENEMKTDPQAMAAARLELACISPRYAYTVALDADILEQHHQYDEEEELVILYVVIEDGNIHIIPAHILWYKYYIFFMKW